MSPSLKILTASAALAVGQAFVAIPSLAQTDSNTNMQYTTPSGAATSTDATGNIGDTTSPATDTASNAALPWLIPLAIVIPLALWAYSRLKGKTRRHTDQHQYHYQDFGLSGAKGGETERTRDDREVDPYRDQEL